MSWVLIQRVTLPLAVFFRFHSAVVSIELWKEVYASKPEDEAGERQYQLRDLGQNPRLKQTNKDPEEESREMPQIILNQGDVHNDL